jgi:hypothetical protein
MAVKPPLIVNGAKDDDLGKLLARVGRIGCDAADLEKLLAAVLNLRVA